jgi:phenylpropionate dioxygenase-like ring-hydroxylating dioxygenase large terminal subunit
MRQYWIPVLRSAQLLPGAPPRRVTVMGDDFVAFRTPDGRLGLRDEACPHRGVSLMLGRVEECGLRCVYHGWTYAPSGELIEAPTYDSVTPPATVDALVRKRAHPVRESQGMVWTYIGPGEAPPFPRFSFTDLPESHVLATTAIVNCNWLHPLETLWDVFHAQILHNRTNRAMPRGKVYFSKSGRVAGDLEYDYPTMRAWRTDAGFSYSNDDTAKETNFHFIMPFFQHHTLTPVPTDDKGIQISVPIDDDHCLLWEVMYNRFAPLNPDGFAMQGFGHVADLSNFMAGMDERTKDNRWGQDRESMDRGESFSGVVGLKGVALILGEDLMVIESQGRVDRSAEILAPTDRALIEGRRTILDAVHAFERGEPPLGRDLDHSGIEAVFHVKAAM